MDFTNETFKTHNGHVTIENPETGGHRTFQIRTQKQDARFAPGSRIVSLLDGPDNETSYSGFGFVNQTGINVWKSKAGGKFDTYARMIQDPEYWTNERGLHYHFSEKCRICNRTLTTPESIERGIGPVCFRKM